MKVIFLVLVVLSTAYAADQQAPLPPRVWPPNWYTWVVTSVVKVGEKPQYNVGQLIAYDMTNQQACRFLQQNLLTPVPNRPVDVCEYTSGNHYMMDDTTANTTCKGIAKIQGSLTQMVYPPEYLAVAKFIGVDKVAQKDCNHFVATGMVIDGENVQMDVWTAVDNSFPCQITVTDVTTREITNWAFDGFQNIIPSTANDQCGAGKILCTQANWLCQPVPTTPVAQLVAALQYVCNPTILDCSPINPGGSHYIPNTPLDHCNWALNAYFLLHRASQGFGACSFGGIGRLVPPPPATSQSSAASSSNSSTNMLATLRQLISDNIVCDRTQNQTLTQ